jgi:hypothetical protein
VVGGVIDIADHKIGDLIFKYLGEYESIFEKELHHLSGAQMKFFNTIN